MRELFRSLLWALLIAGLIRTLLFEPFTIPSGSMKPNFLVGDYLIVTKYNYGYSTYSLPFGINLAPGRMFYKQPERGDVIVFRHPATPGKFIIKRMVGLPGDDVQMINGKLHINGHSVKLNPMPPFNDEGKLVRRYREILPEGRSYEILDLYDNYFADNTIKYRVPEGYFFFLGDNRDDSKDSRSDMGMIKAEYLIGKAQLIILSVKGGWSDLLHPSKLLDLSRSFKWAQ